eukprot:18165-Pelagomonas_calceolata.AAC.3
MSGAKCTAQNDHAGSLAFSENLSNTGKTGALPPKGTLLPPDASTCLASLNNLASATLNHPSSNATSNNVNPIPLLSCKPTLHYDKFTCNYAGCSLSTSSKVSSKASVFLEAGFNGLEHKQTLHIY